MQTSHSRPIRIDPTDLGPVREFLAHPIGHHSAALDAILSVLRSGPIGNKLCVICVEPHRAWVIGTLSDERGRAPIVTDNRVFRCIEDAERAIFKLRWSAETGVTLDEVLS